MTIDKAIVIKENHQRLHLDEYYQELLEADNLSIMALKKWKQLREGRAGVIDPLLPGETQ